MASNALALIDLPTTSLSPVRLVREDEIVKVRYLESGAEFRLDAYQPVHAMHTVTANDDPTSVEVCANNMLALQQVTEDGETKTIMLSPAMAIELSRLIDSYVVFPLGLNSE